MIKGINVRKLAVFILTFSLWSFFASSAYGQTVINLAAPTNIVQGDKITVSKVVQFIFNFLVALGIIAALAYLLYGGVRWITSAGDKAAVENARNHIVSAIIGLLVLVLAWVIVSLVMTILGLPAVPPEITIPKLT